MKYILITCLSFVFIACGTTKKKEKDEVSTEIMWDEMQMTLDTMSIDLTTQKVFHAAEEIKTDLIHTKLEVSFDWANSRMFGLASITAKPHFYSSDSLILDAKGMEIKSVKLAGKDLAYKYDSAYLKIKLDKAYTRSEKYTVLIDYISKPNERTTSGSAAITSDKGLYFINPKGEDKNVMPQIWTQGETESSSVWFPTIDAPNVKTTQEIFITVDQKYVTLSNGKMLASVTNANGTRTDHWKQDLPHAPYLFMMGVGEFKIVKDSYTRPDGTKMDVNYYVEPEWEQYGKAIFGETPAMIAFFSKLTGVEYVWDKYDQIVVRDYVSGAMENTGAVVFGDFVYKTDRELLDENDNSTIAHELFHHWFGDLVTCESWSNLTLNESFANYSQYLWDEHRYGIDEADYNAEFEKDGYYQGLENGSNGHDLVWYDYKDKEEMFDGHSYNKGGRILHMLRNYLGDEAFFEGLKLYLKTNQFKAAEFNHLRLAFEEVSGKDLNWFFNQWYTASGHPNLNIEQNYTPNSKEVVLRIFQNQDLNGTPLYQLPVQVMVYDDAGEHLHNISIDKYENDYAFPVVGTLHNVIFDYQQCLLGKIQENKPAEQYVHQYYHGKRYMARREGLLNGSVETDLASQQMVLDALKDPFFDIRISAINMAGSLQGENLKKAISMIGELALNDPKSQVRAEAIRFLSKNNPGAEFGTIASEIIQKDQSYSVVGAALNELSKSNVELAMTKAKSLENEPSSRMKSTISQIYAARGEADKLPFFEKIMSESTKGYDGIICLNSFTVFMSRQKIDLQEKALALYKKQFEIGGFYTRMFMPQNINYLIETLGEQLVEGKAKMEAFEKNKDFVEADKLRKVIKRQEVLVSDLSAYMNEVSTLLGN